MYTKFLIKVLSFLYSMLLFRTGELNSSHLRTLSLIIRKKGIGPDS